MSYLASIKIYDTDSGAKIIDLKNENAEKALAAALAIIQQKHGNSSIIAVLKFLKKDFQELTKKIKKF